MELNEILFVIVVFVANAIHAVTGFAGTLLAMPAAIHLVGISQARVSLNLIGILCCLVLGYGNYKSVNWKEVKTICAYMVCGMAAGLVLLKRLPLQWLLVVYGGLIIVIALKNIFIKKETGIPEKYLPVVLFFAGVIHGIFISGGALLVVYAKQQMQDKEVFRATLTPVWIFLNVLLLIEQLFSHSISVHSLALTGACIIPVFASVFIGNWLYKRTSQKVFWNLSNGLLLLSGILILL